MQLSTLQPCSLAVQLSTLHPCSLDLGEAAWQLEAFTVQLRKLSRLSFSSLWGWSVQLAKPPLQLAASMVLSFEPATPSCGEKLSNSFPPRGSAKEKLVVTAVWLKDKMAAASSLHLQSLAMTKN